MFVEKVQPNIQLIHLNAEKKQLNSEFVWWLCSVFSISTWFVLVLMWRVDFYDDVFMYLGQIFLVSCFLSRFHRICFKFLLDLTLKKFFLLFNRFERFKKLCVNKHVKLKSCLCLTWLSNTWPLTFVSYRCVRWETDWTDGGGSPEVLLFLFQSVWEKRH